MSHDVVMLLFFKPLHKRVKRRSTGGPHLPKEQHVCDISQYTSLSEQSAQHFLCFFFFEDQAEYVTPLAEKAS